MRNVTHYYLVIYLDGSKEIQIDSVIKMIKWLVVSIAIAQSFVTFILADFRHQPSSENAGIDYYLGSNLSSNGPRYEYMPVEERFEILPTQTVKTPNSEDPTRTVETRDNEGLTYQKVSKLLYFQG